jgi:hypothetical protein
MRQGAETIDVILRRIIRQNVKRKGWRSFELSLFDRLELVELCFVKFSVQIAVFELVDLSADLEVAEP